MKTYYFKIKTKNAKYPSIVYCTDRYNIFKYEFLEKKVINDKKKIFIQSCANNFIDSTSIWTQR